MLDKFFGFFMKDLTVSRTLGQTHRHVYIYFYQVRDVPGTP